MKRILKLLLLFFVYQLAVTAVFTGIFMLWYHRMEMPNPSDDYYVTFLLAVQVAFTALLSLHLLVGRYVKLDKQQLGLVNAPWMWGLSFIFMLGLGLWNNYLNELVDLPNTMEAFFEDMMRHPLGIIATVVMAPIMEELLFRGAIQGYLLRHWKNPLGAILLSSFLFGAVHGNPAQIPFAFIIGLGLGWVYYKTGSLVPCVFMHFINNGSAVLIFWLTQNSKGTLVEIYGLKMATLLAVIGMALTILGFVGITKCMRGKEISWFGAQE